MFGGMLGRVYPDHGGLATDTLYDLWKFDGRNWTWVSGPSTANDPGKFGAKSTPAATNMPRARAGAVPWVDGSGKFSLFGGAYYQSSSAGFKGGLKYLNDLWRYEQ
jgi:hypothetical protein